MAEFNSELCEERHENIKLLEVEVFKRLKEVENRWLVLMTALTANLIGVIAILVTK